MSRELLKNTVLALLAETPGLGEIQLRKALVIIDALNNIFYGQGLTGTRYIKYPMGPVPDDESMQFIWDMARKGDIYLKEEPVGTWTKRAYYMKSDPDYAIFNDVQTSIIQEAARFAAKNTARNLSELTHDENYMKTPMHHEIRLEDIGTMRSCVPKKLSAEERKKIGERLRGAEEDLKEIIGATSETHPFAAFV
jgi:hypothetical protein